MNKKTQKKLDSIIPGWGVGANVVEGDLNFALRQLKKSLKESGKMTAVYDRQQFTKPSIVKRKQRLEAAYRQQKESARW